MPREIIGHPAIAETAIVAKNRIMLCLPLAAAVMPGEIKREEGEIIDRLVIGEIAQGVITTLVVGDAARGVIAARLHPEQNPVLGIPRR